MYKLLILSDKNKYKGDSRSVNYDIDYLVNLGNTELSKEEIIDHINRVKKNKTFKKGIEKKKGYWYVNNLDRIITNIPKLYRSLDKNLDFLSILIDNKEEVKLDLIRIVFDVSQKTFNYILDAAISEYGEEKIKKYLKELKVIFIKNDIMDYPENFNFEFVTEINLKELESYKGNNLLALIDDYDEYVYLNDNLETITKILKEKGQSLRIYPLYYNFKFIIKVPKIKNLEILYFDDILVNYLWR